MRRCFGSAEPPAHRSTDSRDALQTGATSECSASRSTGYSDVYRLAFYIIGGRDATPERDVPIIGDGLATEICNMVRDKCVDAVGISEVFNHGTYCTSHHGWQQRQFIMELIVFKLNSTPGQPASSEDSSNERPAWKAQSDGRYVFLWNSNRLVLTAYKYISCDIKEHPWRMAQYLQFQHAESHSGPPLHICHHCMYVNIASTATKQLCSSAPRPATYGRQKINLSTCISSYITISEHTALAYPQDHLQLPPVPELSSILSRLNSAEQPATSFLSTVKVDETTARRKMLEEAVTDLSKRIFTVEGAVLTSCRCRQEFVWVENAKAFPDEPADAEGKRSSVKIDEATEHSQMLAEEMTELSKTVFILEQAVLKSCTCRPEHTALAYPQVPELSSILLADNLQLPPVPEWSSILSRLSNADQPATLK